mmetsp:Transcript_15668/g.47385  ORF Transcript_15668/g.47385 Transcript_15668/m.47385 type:complete len:190 (+) Transcript_15668:44-613(+)
MAGALQWVAFAMYLEWGLIHVFAGSISYYFVYVADIGGYLTGICASAPKSMHEEAKKLTAVNPMTVRILIQHAFNLFTVGLFSIALAVLVVAQLNRMAWYLGLWPFVLDVGYFIAIDLVAYGPPPGEAQTVIISVGQICAALAVNKKFNVGAVEYFITLIVPACLILAAVVNKGLHLLRGPPPDSPPLV